MCALALTLDLILLLLWALVIFLAVRRGFFAAALQLGAWIVSIALAGFLSGLLAQPLYEAFVRSWAQGLIEGQIDQAVQSSQVAQYAQEVLAGLPQSLAQLAQMAGISTQGLIGDLQARQFSSANAAQLLEETIVAPLAVAAIRILLSLILFTLLLIATRLVCRQLEKLRRLPVLKQADRLLGAALGLLKGALLVSVLALALRATAALEFGGPEFIQGVDGSYIVSALEWIRL